MPLRESREKAGKVQICEPGYLPVLCDQKLPFKASTQIRRIYHSGLLTCTCGAVFFVLQEIVFCKAKMLRKDAFHGLPDNIILCVMEVHK